MNDTRTLARSCEATRIPSGESVLIPEGAVVTITHRLGGNFTVLGESGLYRIAQKDADALGETVAASVGSMSSSASSESAPSLQAVWDQLKGVFDPEIPVNIVDLGLVYCVDLNEIQSGQYRVTVSMTLTSPGCGMGPVIAAEAKQRCVDIPGIADAVVDLVWDPPWTQDMISEEGKMALGLL